MARFPYLIVYSLAPAATESETPQVAVLRVLHEAMQWPPADDVG